MSERLTLEALDRFLAPAAPARSVTGYVRAAAVLAAFDLRMLEPAGDDAAYVAGDHLIDELLPLCEAVTEGPDKGLWSLTSSERRKALRSMKTRSEMKNALEANPQRRTSTLQRMLELIIKGSTISLESLSREELVALLTARDWVNEILDSLPDPESIQQTIRLRDHFAPMQRLVSGAFVGRAPEVAQLVQFVSLPALPSQRPPLFVFGTGGIGKSTLLAHFVLSYAMENSLPVAYLDLDKPTMRADVPLTLLLDALNQLWWQLGALPITAESVEKELTFAIRRTESGRQLESVSSGFASIGLFISYMNQWLASRTAVLIVDTMEEAQFLGDDVMWPLISLLFEINRQVPGIRLILSGRSLADAYLQQLTSSGAWIPSIGNWRDLPLPFRPISLEELDSNEARLLLSRLLLEDNLPLLSDDELDEILRIVSRNPMCVRLAARLLREEGIEKLRTAHREVLAHLKAEKVQAMLYGRILDHIRIEDVRKLAYPGLVVRRIDPSVIRDVLAGPCGLTLTPPRDEFALFSDLEKEAALVERSFEDNSVRHRPDVRRVMLEDLLDHVDAMVVEQIDLAAIAHYSRLSGPISRAEEIYHRLRRGEESSTLNLRWDPAGARYLQGALEEVRGEQRLWLAEKLNVTLQDSDRESADQEAWERQVARSADRYLRAGSPQSALEVLHERSSRQPRSSLFALESEAYRQVGDFPNALKVARDGVDSALRVGAIDMALDLLLRVVVIDEVMGDLCSAESTVQEAEEIAAHSASPILQLRVEVTALRIQRQLHPETREARAERREKIVSQLSDQMVLKLREYPVLLREAAAELGKQDPRIVAAAFETLGAEVATDSQAVSLGQAIASLNARENQSQFDSTVSRAAEHFEKVKFDPSEIRKWVIEEMTPSDISSLGGVVASVEPRDQTLSSFREYFREGVSQTLRGTAPDGIEYPGTA